MLDHEVLSEVNKADPLLKKGYQTLPIILFRQLNVLSASNVSLFDYPLGISDVSNLMRIYISVLLPRTPDKVIDLVFTSQLQKDLLDIENLCFYRLWDIEGARAH